MPTAMENALREAGVALPPLSQRVWQWIKDHPDHTATETAKALGAERTRVAAVCTVLLRRNMLVRQADKTYRKMSGRSSVWRYKVNPSMRGVFELLPIVNREKIRMPKSGTCVPTALQESHQPEPDVEVTEDQWLHGLIKSLSLLQAQKLYGRLKEIFQS